MSRTFLYGLLVAAVGALFAVAFVGRLDPPAAEISEREEAATSAEATVVVPGAALASLRESERTLLREQARGVAGHPDVLRMVDPARAVRPSAPVLKPGAPPTRSGAAVVPTQEELSGPAQTAIDAASEATGATLALVDATENSVVASSQRADTLDPTVLLDKFPRSGDALAITSGVLVSDGVQDVVSISVNGGTHVLLVARPVSADRLAGYAAGLGEGAVVSIANNGELVATSAASDVAEALALPFAELNNPAAVAEPPAEFTDEPTAAPGGGPLHHAAAVEPNVAVEPSPTALVVSVRGPVPSAAPKSTSGSDKSAEVVAPTFADALKSPFQDPGKYGALLGGAAAAVLVIALLGLFVGRSERKAELASLRKRVDDADRLDDIVDPTAVAIVDTVREKLPKPKAVAPLPTKPSKALEKRLDQVKAELREAKLELESAQSKQTQQASQLTHARGLVAKAEKTAELARTERAGLAAENQKLNKELDGLRRELATAQAARTTVSEVVPADDPALITRETDLGEAPDDLFASAFDALEEASASAAPQPPPMSAMRKPKSSKKLRIPPPKGGAKVKRKDYDTAEVNSDEMNQLLDSSERQTGEFDNIEIPGEAFPSEEFPELGEGSLEDFADRLTSMSDSQLARLDDVEEEDGAAVSRTASSSSLGDRSGDTSVPGEEILAHGNTTSPGLPGGSGGTQQLFGIKPKAANPARSTLPGGLRFDATGEDSSLGDDAPAHPTAPPPWKKKDDDSQPPRSLSPAGLLEALKKRGTQPPPEAEADRASRFGRGLLDHKTPVRQAKPKSVSQSGLFSRTGSRVDIDPTNDSEYFKSLYEDFVETKKRCGESVDKITLERFVNRLARNKAQLLERYNCRTVRFQVYVKEGKAALKATPVK